MKVSVNCAKAKSTEKHNDRSLYHEKSPSEFERDEHPQNLHWDCYNCGSSFKAEKMWYEATFRKTLDEQNKKAIQMEHPGRVMTMDQYHKKHMPKELIIQLGNKDERPQDDWIPKAAEKTKRQLEKAGLVVLSIDIHYDEATPHAHIRFAGVANDRMNFSRAMKNAGMMTPLEQTCEKLGFPKDTEPLDPSHVEALKKELPEFYYQRQTDGKLCFKTSANSCLNVLCNQVIREPLEELGRDMGYEIDSNHVRKTHKEIAEYKNAQEAEKTKKYLNQSIEKAKDERDKFRDISYRNAKKAISEIWKDDDTVWRDSDGDPIDKKWFSDFRENVKQADWRESKKDRVNNLLSELERTISEPEPDLDGLERAQEEYNRQQVAKQEQERKAREAARREQERAQAEAAAEAERLRKEKAAKEESRSTRSKGGFGGR